MVAGVIDTLRPFLVSDDQMSRMLFHTLKRFLQRATIEDLIQVLVGAQNFCDEMEPYKDEYYRLQAEALSGSLDDGRLDSGSGTDDGSGSDGRDDPVREIDPTGSDSEELLTTLRAITGDESITAETVAEALSLLGSGHETTLAGDDSANGGQSPKEIPELREGGHATSGNP